MQTLNRVDQDEVAYYELPHHYVFYAVQLFSFLSASNIKGIQTWDLDHTSWWGSGQTVMLRAGGTEPQMFGLKSLSPSTGSRLQNLDLWDISLLWF